MSRLLKPRAMRFATSRSRGVSAVSGDTVDSGPDGVAGVETGVG
jgi:hypothetical protein